MIHIFKELLLLIEWLAMAEMLWNRRNLSRHGIKLQDLRQAIQIAIVNAAVYFANCCKSPTISNVQAFQGDK